MDKFFKDSALLNHPLRVLNDFLEKEKKLEQSGEYEKMRFVGYILDIGYDIVTLITSDPFKIAVGGVPRNSLLIMVPHNLDELTPHFTLLRVLETAPTPLSKEVQQTYFELQKKSMPELDVFTQSELQWGALKTATLGMFYPHTEKANEIEFSGDLNNYVSAHKYMVYAPDDELLDLIVNSMVPDINRFPLGKLRMTECRLPLPEKKLPDVDIFVSTRDFMGARTAMFGKTRLGKSNIVKLLVQSLIETTKESKNVGQLIFDINGEYANDNPQDDNLSIAGVYSDHCHIYALTPKPDTPSKPLKLNFYAQPDKSLKIVSSLLKNDGRASGYVQTFASVELPVLEEVHKLPLGSDKNRAIRKIQIYWAILKKAGYEIDENELKRTAPKAKDVKDFNPCFNAGVRSAAYSYNKIKDMPENPATLNQLIRELEVINKFRRENPNDKNLISSSGNPLFEPDDIALLEFLAPQPGRSGTSLIQPYRMYHDRSAGDFISEILSLLDDGKTVILDLGNANEEVRDYFSDELSTSVFNLQNMKFTANNLQNKFVQLYFEEAHNLFPKNDDSKSIYSRFAKEGAKYHIGMVYSTQSPSTISKDLLAQTENFFIAHLSSVDDVNTLAKVNVAYDSLKDDILRAKTPGYVRMLTRSHRFVVSAQANKFSPIK